MIEDYNIYKLNFFEKLFCFLKGSISVFLITYLAYRSFYFSLTSSILGIFYIKEYKKKIIERRKEELLIQFKEFLYSLVISLSSGYSFENSIKNTIEDLKIIYPNGSNITRELMEINKKIEFGISAEKAIEDFASKTGLEDIENFSQSYLISSKMGGNMIETIKDTGNFIIEKINANDEIKVIISEKVFELKILKLFPFFILFILNYCCYDFIKIIYESIDGKIFITIAMGIVFLGIFIADSMCKKRL